MPLRAAWERPYDVEAVPLIERRRLERVSLKRELATTSTSRLCLGRLQESSADAPAPHVFAHPERINPASPAPAPAVHAGHKLAAAIVSTVRSSRKSRMPVASTLNSLISSIKRRAVARSGSLKASLLGSSVITVALSLPVQTAWAARSWTFSPSGRAAAQ
jgi:hypothetical protein